MKTYSGTVKYPVGEPYDGGYGPRVNVAVEVADASAPKIKDGVVRVYKPVLIVSGGWTAAKPADIDELMYMQSLQTGDPVTLAHMTKGTQSWYQFIIPEEAPVPEPIAHSSQQPATSYPAKAQIYIPLTPENISIYTQVLSDEADLLLHALHVVNTKIEQGGLELDSETAWKLTATAHIGAMKKYHANLVLEIEEEGPPF